VGRIFNSQVQVVVMSRLCIGKQNGFTFIEILVVITIMTLALSITIPAIWKGLNKTKLNAFVREMSSTFRYARSRAISTKSKVTISVDLTNNTYTFKEQSNQKIKKESGSQNGEPTDDSFEPEQYESDEDRHSSEVKFADVPYDIIGFRTSADDQLIEEGSVSVNFFPLGNSDGGEFIIAGSRENMFFILAIDQITGRVTIQEELSYY
jgi:prepilin-type N-terminal cleavage/methylation domain-containing protein